MGIQKAEETDMLLEIIIGILLFLILSVLLLSFFIVLTISKPRRIKKEDVYQIEVDKGYIDKTWYESIASHEYKVKSKHGYPLFMKQLIQAVPSNKVIVMVHGHGFNHVGSIKYIRIFYDLGYDVILFDNTNCGESGGNVTTMGKKESDDLESILDTVVFLYGSGVSIGLHGESLGAASSLLFASKHPERIRFVIADCGYSDFKKEVAHQIKRRFKREVPLLVATSNLLCKFLYQFSFDEVSPVHHIGSDALRNLPILFIHGEKDGYTPVSMSEELYAIKKGVKELYLAKNATHAESFGSDKQEYARQITLFLEKK